MDFYVQEKKTHKNTTHTPPLGDMKVAEGLFLKKKRDAILSPGQNMAFSP